MRTLFLLLLFTCPFRAGIVDRLAITVGSQVITELQIDEEIRVTSFLDHQTLNRNALIRTAAADRLINQLLVKREMELSEYPLPEPGEIDAYENQVRATFPSALDFDQEMKRFHLSERILRNHLALQLTTIRFVELRFHTNVTGQTEDGLNSWLEESRKQANIVYLDKSLQ